MNAVTSVAAAVAASPFAADPVGTKRPQLDFADDPQNPTRIRDGYIGRGPGITELIFGGGSFLSERAEAGAIALGYDPAAALYQFSATGAAELNRGDDGHLSAPRDVIDDATDEVWVAFWYVDGNVEDPETGGLSAKNTTFVRVI